MRLLSISAGPLLCVSSFNFNRAPVQRGIEYGFGMSYIFITVGHNAWLAQNISRNKNTGATETPDRSRVTRFDRAPFFSTDENNTSHCLALIENIEIKLADSRVHANRKNIRPNGTRQFDRDRTKFARDESIVCNEKRERKSSVCLETRKRPRIILINPDCTGVHSAAGQGSLIRLAEQNGDENCKAYF